MFEMILKSAFDAGSEVVVYMNGFHSPLKGRVQDMNTEYFTFFQSGKQGNNVLWAFRLSDVISCGLLIGSPLEHSDRALQAELAEDISYNESDH